MNKPQPIDIKNSTFAYSTVALVLAGAIWFTIQWVGLENRVTLLEKEKDELIKNWASDVAAIRKSLE